MFGNIPTKVLKQSSDVCNAAVRDVWNFEILENLNFPQNLKLADITPVYKKKDPTLVENYQPISVIIQRQFSSFINCFVSPYLCGYREGVKIQFTLLSHIEKWKKNT